MSYDIPDEIKYREKIVFGLDIKQLCYACIFGLLVFFSFNLPLEGEARFILPAFLFTEMRSGDRFAGHSGMHPIFQRSAGV